MTARNRFLYLTVAAYILPVVALSVYASLIFTPTHSFGVFTFGMLLTAAGSLLLYLYCTSQEVILAGPAAVEEKSQPSLFVEEDNSQLKEMATQIEQYQREIYALSRRGEEQEGAIEELHRSKKALERKVEELDRDYLGFQESAKGQQDQYRQLLNEHQQTINEQREALEKKQQHIIQLEGQVRDLNYEIKTLMDVEERQSIVRLPVDRYRPKEFDCVLPSVEDEEILPPPSFVESPDEASQQLRRCLDIAQKITCGHYMHNRPSRLKDLPVENTALEMRRLFDNLRSENQATILLYSPKDNRLLFVNNPIKSLLGWPPEKFVYQFQDLLTDGGEAWKLSISQLAFKNETQTTLCLVARSGQHVSLNCHLGLIPTGSFRHFVLGVLYPTAR